MKVGDLVKVRRTHGREPVTGLIIEIHDDEHNAVALVKPIGTFQPAFGLLYANPLDIEVISASR